MYNMTSKGQVVNSTPGQGHGLNRISHVAYQSIRLVKTDTMNLSWSQYLVSLKSYGQKTVCDL